MDEGYGLDDGQLSVQAHAEDEEGGGEEAQPADAPEARAAGDPFLREEDQRQHGEHQRDDGDLEALVPPGRHPERQLIGRRSDAEGGGQRIGQRDRHGDLAGHGRAGGADLDGEGQRRVDRGRQREKADLLHRRRAVGGKPLLHLVAVFGRLPARVALHHRQPVEGAGFLPLRPPVRLDARGHHDQRSAPCPEIADRLGEILLPQQVAAHGRGVDDAGPEMQEIARTGRDGHLGAGERCGGLGHRHAGLGERAHAQKLVPGGGPVAQPVDAAAAGDDAAGDGEGAGGAQDAVADDPGRDGGAADDVGQAIRRRGRPGGAEVVAREARDIGGDVGIRDTERQHRLVVAHQKRAADRACGCYRHQHVERAPGIADRSRDLPGRADMAGNLAAPADGPARHAARLARDLDRAGQGQERGRFGGGRRAQVGRVLGQRSGRMAGGRHQEQHEEKAQDADHAASHCGICRRPALTKVKERKCDLAAGYAQPHQLNGEIP